MDKDMDKGSGLGLDVVDRIIRNRHQGVITVSLNQAEPVAQSVYPFPEELIDSSKDDKALQGHI